MTKPKRKKRDPLAALKKKYRGPWRITKGIACKFNVVSSASEFIVATNHPALARAIAKLGGGK